MADHGAHGFDQAAGGVHLDDQGTGAVGVGVGDGADELVGGDGLDGVVEDELVDCRLANWLGRCWLGWLLRGRGDGAG